MSSSSTTTTTDGAATHRTVLVTGATGNQGGAVIKALLVSLALHPNPNLSILALSRSTNSPKALALAAKSSQMTLIQGDLDKPAAIFEAYPHHHRITTVYSVQNNYFGSPEKHRIEETQAMGLVDAAVANGVKHFVQSTGDRGGPANSETDPTNVPHFQTKFNIEKYLVKQCAASNGNMTYTILRPTSFMDNVTPDLHGKGFAAMWHCMGSSRPLQLICARDIGRVAAQAITADPEDAQFHNRAISLAGDELTQVQADGVFRKVFSGKPMPKTLAVVGTVVKWTTPEVGSMFKWFEQVGFGADVQACRKEFEGLLDFEQWLREESGFVNPEAGGAHD